MFYRFGQTNITAASSTVSSLPLLTYNDCYRSRIPTIETAALQLPPTRRFSHTTTDTVSAIPAASANHHPITPNTLPLCTVTKRYRPTKTRAFLQSLALGVWRTLLYLATHLLVITTTATATAIPDAVTNTHPITPNMFQLWTVPQRDRPTETRAFFQSPHVRVLQTLIKGIVQLIYHL